MQNLKDEWDDYLKITSRYKSIEYSDLQKLKTEKKKSALEDVLP